MAIVREPLEVDFSIQSEDWTEEELILFRKHLAEQKLENKKKLPLPKTTENEVLN